VPAPDSFSGAALALRECDQRVMDAPVDLDARAHQVRAAAIRALAGNADLVDAFLPRRRLDAVMVDRAREAEAAHAWAAMPLVACP